MCLDVCPTSNVALRVAPTLADHPLPTLLAAGVPVSVNSDCPLFFGSPVLGEYVTAANAFALDTATLTHLATTSLTSSSCPDDRRAEALDRIARWAA